LIQKTTFELPPQQKQKLLLYLNKLVTSQNIGLFHLDVTEMEEIFLPVLEDKFGLKTRFERVWGHYMTKGGERPFHKHSVVTMLYYLDIPNGDVGTFVTHDERIIPKTNDLYLFPEKLQHKITPNNTDKIRWAIASECKPESALFKELVNNK